jgi:hypothetical protein
MTGDEEFVWWYTITDTIFHFRLYLLYKILINKLWVIT